MTGIAFWIVAGVVAGGILHILAVFSIPWLSENNAWARLSAKLPQNTLSIIETPEKPAIPFAAPDVIHAYCPFNISERNVIVTSPLPDPAWSIALSTQSGDNFYVLTGADAKKPSVRIIVIPRDRLAQESSTERDERGEEQNIVVSPTANGVATIRAPIKGQSFKEPLLSVLRQARCDVQRMPDPSELLASAPQPAAAEAPQPTRRTLRRRRRR